MLHVHGHVTIDPPGPCGNVHLQDQTLHRMTVFGARGVAGQAAESVDTLEGAELIVVELQLEALVDQAQAVDGHVEAVLVCQACSVGGVLQLQRGRDEDGADARQVQRQRTH